MRSVSTPWNATDLRNSSGSIRRFTLEQESPSRVSWMSDRTAETVDCHEFGAPPRRGPIYTVATVGSSSPLLPPSFALSPWRRHWVFEYASERLLTMWKPCLHATEAVTHEQRLQVVGRAVRSCSGTLVVKDQELRSPRRPRVRT